MKIKTFSELREAAKDKAAKAQATTKDKESDLFGTSRIKGEQDFRDAHGMDVQIKSNKLKDDNHFSPNLKPATHRADGEKQPIRQGNSSQPGPTKLFQVKEESVTEGSKPKYWHPPSQGAAGAIKPKPAPGVTYTRHPDEDNVKYPDYGNTNPPPRKFRVKDNDGDDETTDSRYIVNKNTKKPELRHRISIEKESVNLGASEDIEQIEMNEDVFSSLKALASSNKSGNLKFKNGETGLVNSKSAGKIVDAYNKLSPENAKQMKAKMNSDVVGFMKVLHFVDKSAKAV